MRLQVVASLTSPRAQAALQVLRRLWRNPAAVLLLLRFIED